ncbi:MAG: WbqC family protein [Spirochaetes bacterium]|nr:WbqC family protein [Spirochaetota bacterium]
MKEKKIIAIQQPEHLPWLGFFDKMKKCDQYIYLDSVQFKKRYFENRNKIRFDSESKWLTVPIMTKSKYHQNINEVLIDNEQKWQRKYIDTIRHAYAKSNFLDAFYPDLTKIIETKYERLVDLNVAIIDWARKLLEISTPVMMSSELKECKDKKGSDLILEICIQLNADVYISGPFGRDYLEHEKFKKADIEIEYHDYTHPVYKQLHEPFISHLSFIDCLFCEGAEGVKALIQNR